MGNLTISSLLRNEKGCGVLNLLIESGKIISLSLIIAETGIKLAKIISQSTLLFALTLEVTSMLNVLESVSIIFTGKSKSKI